MDFSSLPEAQQQQLQQLQTQYQEHQQKQQDEAAATAAASASASASAAQQHQYDPSQPPSYYPSQPQSYDQSYYAYYQHQDPQQSQQYAAYYNNSDYANAYQQQPQQQYSQADTVSYHQPAVSASREAPPPEGQVIEHQHQHNAYYPNTSSGTQVGHGGDQSSSGYNAPNGINTTAAAAAVAALSQLTQFAAERGIGGQQERQWYGNGGGYGSPMGPGQFMGQLHHGPQVGRSSYRGGGRRGGSSFRGGSGPPFRGRGRGRGRGGGPYQPHGTSSSSLLEGTSTEGAGGEPFQAAVGKQQQPMRIAWCELCRVDCTSLEILEQHKNGKRHKKNLQRLEDMKSSYEPTTEVLNDGKSTADAPDNIQQGEGEKLENIPTEVGTDQNQVENENMLKGMKRIMRGGRGGKRLKTFGGPSRRSLGPTKPKVVIPLICDLCNVKCDTQEVFDRHVSGKKHISKVKRFEGHQAMYGPTGVQALYPPNPMAQALLHPPQGPQQVSHGPPQGSYPPPEGYIPPHQVQNPNPQLSDAPLEFSNQNNVPQVQQPSASVETETKQITSG